MKFPLLPYSQLVWDMTRWNPGVYIFPSVICWHGGAVHKDKIEEAFRAVLVNHPVFSSAIDWRGRQYDKPVKDIMHGRYHDVEIVVSGEDAFIRILGSRILCDGKSASILAEDIERVYKGLALEPDDYWGYVERFEQRKSSPHYGSSKVWLINEYKDESVPVRPTMDRRCLYTFFPPKAGIYTDNYTDLHERIILLTETQHLSMDGLFSLCAALAIAEYCGTDTAALTWAYEGRERPEEQRVVGSLHRDIPFRIKVKGERLKAKGDLIRQARNQIRSGIAHSDYPYTLTKPYTKRWNYAVNVLRINEAEDWLRNTDLSVELVSVPPQKYAYALLDIEIHESFEGLNIIYRYSATHYKESSIQRYAALVKKHVLWLLSD